jgi:hypothetical protein
MWKEPDEIVDETDLMWRETSNRFRVWMKNQRNYICPEKNIPSSRGLQRHLDEDTAATQTEREEKRRPHGYKNDSSESPQQQIKRNSPERNKKICFPVHYRKNTPQTPSLCNTISFMFV